MKIADNGFDRQISPRIFPRTGKEQSGTSHRRIQNLHRRENPEDIKTWFRTFSEMGSRYFLTDSCFSRTYSYPDN